MDREDNIGGCVGIPTPAEAVNVDNLFFGREPFVDLRTVAHFLAISIRTLHRLIASSDCFPTHRIGRLWRFRLSEVDRWMQHNNRARRRKQ